MQKHRTEKHFAELLQRLCSVDAGSVYEDAATGKDGNINNIKTNNNNINDNIQGFFPTLYVAEFPGGLYATDALVDAKTITVAPKYLGPQLLLEGPTPIAQVKNETKKKLKNALKIVRDGSIMFSRLLLKLQ